MDTEQVRKQFTDRAKEEKTMSKTLTTLTACALSLALIVPAYAGMSAPAPSSIPSVTQTKAPVGKITLKKGKHGKKGVNKKQTGTTPAPATAPATH